MDDYISMGTTPTIVATLKDTEGNNLDFSLIDTSSFRMYFKQEHSVYVITKSGENLDVIPGLSQVRCTLTQEDTLLFQRDNDVFIEVRWLFNSYTSTGVQMAGKTKIYKRNLLEVLKEEVVT